jgi:hypothetical protein
MQRRREYMFRLSYKLFLLFTILATVGGFLTLLPKSGASYPNLLGYLSLCTFAPAATFYCFFLAGFSCFIRSTLIKDQSGSRQDRVKKHGKSLIPLAIILIIALFYTYRYVEIKSFYADSISTATIQD